MKFEYTVKNTATFYSSLDSEVAFMVSKAPPFVPSRLHQ